MLKRPLLALSCFSSLALATSAFAQEQCATERGALDQFIAQVKSTFETKMEQRKNDFQNRTSSFADDMPDTEGADAAIGLDFSVEWQTETIKLHLPQVTMREQRWVLDLPQVTMKLEEIVFHTPSVVMVPRKVGQYPEFHGLTVRWRDIITHVPETFMQEQRIKMHLPEIRMDSTEMFLHVPEFEMGLQEIKFDIPHFTLEEISVEAAEIKEKIEAESGSFERETKIEVSNFGQEISIGVVNGVSSIFFGCIRFGMLASRANAVQSFAGPEQQMLASISQLEAAQAMEAANQVRHNLSQLVAQRDATITQIDAELEKLSIQEQQTVSTILAEVNQNI